MEKISLSIFSLLLFPSGMVLKPSARVENNISPFVLVGEKGRIPSCWEKMFLTSPTEVFFVVCWLQKVQSLIYAQTRGRLDWMSVSQSHKSPAGSEWQVGWEEKSWGFLAHWSRTAWAVSGSFLPTSSRVAPGELLPVWFHWKRRGVPHLEMNHVSFWGAQEDHAVPVSRVQENSNPKLSTLSAVLMALQGWSSVGAGFQAAFCFSLLSRGGTWGLNSHSDCSSAAEMLLWGTLGRAKAPGLGRVESGIWILWGSPCGWHQLPSLASAEWVETLLTELCA